MLVICRGIEQHRLDPLTAALVGGGVKVLEITLNTTAALEMIEHLRTRYADQLAVGAGTVLTIGEAESAIEHGAQFLVTPHTDRTLIDYAVVRGVPIYPGAFTPSEIVQAYQAGATAIKCFPGSAFGLSYFKELQGPLGHIPMMMMGGIQADNIRDYLRAGCYAVGIGSWLIDHEAMLREDYALIQSRATTLTDLVRTAKNDEK